MDRRRRHHAAPHLPHGARALSVGRRIARATLRIGIVLCLALAAVVLAADHQEYRAPTRAGLRALVRGALPLLALASIHLVALDPPTWLRPRARGVILALGVVLDVALALGMAGRVLHGAPPVFAMLLAVAGILAAGAAALLASERRAPER